MRIRAHLLLLSALVLAPSFIASSIAVQSLEEAQRESAVRGAREAVRSAALLIDGQVRGAIGSLTALAASPALAKGDFASVYQQARALDQPGEVWTALIDDRGALVFNTLLPFGKRVDTPSTLAPVQAVWVAGKPVISDLHIGAVSPQPHTTVYVPALGPGGAHWAFAQVYSAERWNREALRSAAQPGWVVGVIDRKGRFIARNLRGDELIGKSPRPRLVAAAASQASGVMLDHTLEGMDAYVAFDHSELTGWTIAVAAPAAPIDELAMRSVALLAAGALTALLAGGIGAFAIARRVARALDASAEYAASLDAGPATVPPRTGLREADSLNRALGAKAVALAAERVAREAAEVQRAALLAEQTRARERAERENRAKDRFVAQLGHEIRNPMAAIGGAAEVLSKLPSPGPSHAKWVDVVRRQNGRLRRIVDDLLDISRMLAGKTWIEPMPTDLRAAVSQCLADLRASESARGREIVEDLADVRALADPARLEQALANLVGNALRYAPVGTAVDVALARVGGGAEIRVIDRGPGIDPSDLPRLFEPFAQGAPAPGSVPSGLGIGLALARQVAQLHGGDLAAEETPGGGATFVLWIPALDPDPNGADRLGRLSRED